MKYFALILIAALVAVSFTGFGEFVGLVAVEVAARTTATHVAYGFMSLFALVFCTWVYVSLTPRNKPYESPYLEAIKEYEAEQALMRKAKAEAEAQAQAQAQADAQVDDLFDSIQDGIDKYDASIKAEYADNLRVLYSLARDMEGSGYIDQYNQTMLDWAAYSEQEPDRFGLRSLTRAVERAHDVFDTPPKTTVWRVNRNTLQAVSEVFRGNDDCLYFIIRDELVLSVIFEEDNIFLCAAEPHFVWMAVQYAEEGHIERVE